jgi:hypothetical protein
MSKHVLSSEQVKELHDVASACPVARTLWGTIALDPVEKGRGDEFLGKRRSVSNGFVLRKPVPCSAA